MSPSLGSRSAGLMDQAIGFTERAVAERDPLVLWMRVTQFAEAIREHPRFGEVVGTVWS